MAWYKHLNRYHWWVLIVSALGWLFDTMDQRLFILSRQPALKELMAAELEGMEPAAASAKVKELVGTATAIFLVGWATGGLVFGIMGDKWGRARTMLLTIAVYSLFTGLTAFSRGYWDFLLYRFLAGLGVGGEFAAGVALVAEVMPAAARAQALGLLQQLSAVGNIMGSIICFLLLDHHVVIPAYLGGDGTSLFAGWRIVSLVGILPALLVIAVRRRLQEPDTWRQAKEHAVKHRLAGGAPGDVKQLGDIGELLGDPVWRGRALVGVFLAMAGVIGLWGVGFWTPELIGEIAPEDRNRVASWAMILQDIGAFFGIWAFTTIATLLGRRLAFFLSFLIAYGATALVFGTMNTREEIYWMIPLLGFCNLSVFGGFAIYFPELFPTRLRSTGTSFCYNVARYLAAAGPLTLGHLTGAFVAAGYTGSTPFRYAALVVALIYFVGIVVLAFAPETKDRPLPE